MASPQLQDVINARRANPYTPDKTVEQLRAESNKKGSAIPLYEGTQIEAVSAGGVPSEWISAPGSDQGRVFLFIHGGGYYRGSVAATRSTVSNISAATGMRGLSIEYRLAPEHPFPAAVDDAHAAYRWLLKQGQDPAQVVVGGISAGGGLTLALLLAIRDAGEPLPGGAVPICAWTDLAQTGESFVTKAAADPSISKPYLDRWAVAYLNGADPKTPLASPLYADLHGLPPLLVQVGTAETMLNDSTAFAKRALDAGVDVILEEWEDMVHGWHGSAHVLPEGQQAIDRIAEWITEKLG